MMKRIKGILSLLLALLICVGFLPPTAKAEWDNMGFSQINITNAGAEGSLDYSWASGEFADQINGEDMLSTENLKLRLMLKAATLEETFHYYFLASDSATTHELTLYGNRHVDPATISMTGVTLLEGGFVEHIYGSGQGAIYYYVSKISVPAKGCTAVIKIGDSTLSTLSLRRVIPTTFIPQVSTIWTESYVENSEGKITSFILRVSGYGMYSPSHPEWYRLILAWDTEDADMIQCVAVSDMDDVGCFELAFVVGDYDEPNEWVWPDLWYKNERCYYFDESNLMYEKNENGYDDLDKPVVDYDGNYRTKGYDETIFVHIKGLNGNGETYEDESWAEQYIDHPYYTYLGGSVGYPTPYYCVNYKPSDYKILVDADNPAQAVPALTGTVENVGVATVNGARLVGAWYDSEGRMLGCAAQTIDINGKTGFTLVRPTGTENAMEYRLFLLDGTTFVPLRGSVSGWYSAN